MSYRDQRFIGVINADSIASSNFIIGTGNFADGSTLIADVNISSGDQNLIRPGQIVFSVGGALPANTLISSVNDDFTQITLNKAATSAVSGDTFGLSTPSGSYLFQSASFNDPNNTLSVNNISGSDSGSNFAIVGVAKKNNATAKNRFHLYTISEVIQRNIGSSEISFFVEWGEQGTESGSGDILQTAEKLVTIIDLTDTGSIAPGFSLGVAGMEGLKAGSEYAGYNIAINQYLSDLSGSVGSSLTGSLSGSVTGSLIGTATSASTAVLAQTSSVATIANTLSPLATASRADSATTASFPERGVIAGSVNQNVITLNRGDGTTITLETSVSGSVESASIATIANTVRNGGSGSFSGSFQGDGSDLTAVTAISSSTAILAQTASVAIIANTLSPLATASHALTAVTSSHAISASYAVSASVEVFKELSSSFADTASFAQGGRGLFTGSFSASNFTFDGGTLIVSGNVFVDGTLDAATKNFRIQHPSMPGYYLIHSSLEGPERGIYYRGKLKTNNIIHLPDYWEDLTDETDISVQLTPIGNACQHFVKSVSKKEIEVGCDCGKPHCYYIVHAQRFNEGRLDILKPKTTKGL